MKRLLLRCFYSKFKKDNNNSAVFNTLILHLDHKGALPLSNISDEPSEHLQWPHEKVHEHASKDIWDPVEDVHGDVEKSKEAEEVSTDVPWDDDPGGKNPTPVVDEVESISLEEFLEWSPEDDAEWPDVPDDTDVMGVRFYGLHIFFNVYN